MVTLDWDLTREDGVTLVGLFIEADRRCRVRIKNCLDGPIWPPQRRGQPAPGWDPDDGTFTGVVPADGRLAVGYATDAPPAEPPAEIVSTEPAGPPANGAATGTAADSTEPGSANHRDEPSVPAVPANASGVIRSLGDPLVPRDSVPLGRNGDSPPHHDPAEASGGTAAIDAGTIDDGPSRGGRSATQAADSAPAGPDQPASPERRVTRQPPHAADPDSSAAALVVPGPVRAWVRDVECRLAAIERGAPPDTDADEPSTTDLASAVATDRRALAWLSDRVAALQARADRQ